MKDNCIKTLNPKERNKDVIVIVSGLPRSGTSMMMKILEAGGIDPLTDNTRTPDNDNPKGYYEFERVKKLKSDKEWLPLARGGSVKIISMLLQDLPLKYTYKIIFMNRDMEEILNSQQKMLINQKKTSNDKSQQAMLTEIYSKHLRSIECWLAKQPNFEVLYMNYYEVLSNPRKCCNMINDFLENRLDVTMAEGAVDKKLYRNRYKQIR